MNIFLKSSVCALAIGLAACGGSNSSSPSNPTEPTEFIASDADFRGYTNWTTTKYSVGGTNAALGGAHEANNSEFARLAFENDSAQTRMGGDYPMGSIIVKETFTTVLGEKAHADMGGVLAKAKRGGDFNQANNGWEWFILTAEGAISARGADLMDNACNVCHSGATGDLGNDFSFNIQQEYVANDADFVNYQSWVRIESATGDSPANGGAHAVNSTRNTYKKQASASPYLEVDGYPVGTVIVKEIMRADGSLGTVYGMVKRGGDFSPESAGWEWFLLDNTNQQINTRSEGGGLGYCTSCHIQAGNPSLVDSHPSYRGSDFVFYKKDDPVPLPNETATIRF